MVYAQESDSWGNEEYKMLELDNFRPYPCKKCGNPFVEVSSAPLPDNNENGTKAEGSAIMCPHCGTMSGVYDVPWKAILEWNRKKASSIQDTVEHEETKKNKGYTLTIRDFARECGIKIKGKLRRVGIEGETVGIRNNWGNYPLTFGHEPV